MDISSLALGKAYILDRHLVFIPTSLAPPGFSFITTVSFDFRTCEYRMLNLVLNPTVTIAEFNMTELCEVMYPRLQKFIETYRNVSSSDES